MKNKKGPSSKITFSGRSKIMLSLLVQLAKHDPNVPMNINAIADAIAVSANYIVRLSRPLVKAGIIHTTTGAKGGYSLTCDPAELTVLDIMDLVEPDNVVFGCVENPKACGVSPSCEGRLFWTDISNQIRAIFATITLEKMIELHGSNPPKMTFFKNKK